MDRADVDRWMQEYRAFTARNPERKAAFETRSGIPIEPVFTSADLEGFAEGKDLGLPGQYPFTRGVYPTMYRGRLWTKSMIVGLQTAEVFNERQKQLLAAGQTGINLMPCNATNRGYDTDMVETELIGRCGTALDSLRDMEIAFQDIPLDRVTTAISDPAPFGIVASYFALADRQGIPLSSLQGTTNQSDFLDHYVASNMWLRLGLEGHMRVLMDHMVFCTKHAPRWHPLSIKGDIHEAGGTVVQEIAFALCDAICYINEGIKRRLKVDDFVPRISFYLQVGNDFFEEIAKLRAVRRMWAKITRDRFGAQDPRSWVCRFHCQTMGVDLTQQQVLNNIARACLHTLAAVLGGANAIHTDSYDEAWWSPSEKAQRVALMTQNIIAEETGIPDVIDPLGGSYYVEHLTNEVERRAWEYIDKVDNLGGMVEAVKKGYVQREITQAALKMQRDIDAGSRVVVGVNKYVIPENLDPPPHEQLKVDPGVVAAQIERTKRLRQERDQRKVASALEHLRQVAKGQGNVFEATIEAVKADGTNGEVVQELRRVFGFGRPLIDMI